MLIIDRFEGDFAVVEDGEKMINIRREFIEEDACEGDVLSLLDSFYTIDRAATEERRKETAELLGRIGE